jgi:hypothetical protein
VKNDPALSASELNSRIYEVFARTFSEETKSKKAAEVLSRIVPNEEVVLPERIKFSGRKYQELLGYLIILHYVDDELLQWYIRIDLELFLIKNFQFYWLSVLTEEREFLLKWLLNQRTITSRTFFGNICCKKNLIRCWNLIKIRFSTRIRPKRTQRHRGYRDKGTLPALDVRILRKELDKDVYLREEQQKIEKTRLLQENNIRLFRSYLEQDGSLEERLLQEFRIIPKEETEDER